MIPPRAAFPDGFIFGAATAAYQIEGSGFGGAGPSHWDTFAATPGNVVRAEGGARACDHYHRWPEDLDLARAAHFDAWRFSVNWSRLCPDGLIPNSEGFDFYDRLVDGMAERGLAPYLTLYHWDLPAALADLGGWRNRDTCHRFADMTEAVIARLGDRLASVATINEPWCAAWLSHFLGAHAPGLRDIRAAARAMHHILLAHGLGMERMRAMGQRNLGIVLNFDHCTPASDTPADLAASARQDAIFNRWFIEAITRQSYPAEALEGLAPYMPAGWEQDMPLIGQRLDWLGVNYYTRHIQQAVPDAPWPALREIDGPLPKTQMGWEIYPEGLESFLIRLSRDYIGDLPVFITENGMASADAPDAGGQIADEGRIAFLTRHIEAAQRAMAAGCNLKGYFCWSMLDNYEWAEGYEKRFGLVHVDYDSLTRTPKASYHALRQALARN